jgi:hypothetical protein
MYSDQEQSWIRAGFLAVELELGLTFVRLAAERKCSGDMERYVLLQRNAEKVALAVRRFRRLVNAHDRVQIDSGLVELDRRLAALAAEPQKPSRRHQ